MSVGVGDTLKGFSFISSMAGPQTEKLTSLSLHFLHKNEDNYTTTCEGLRLMRL